ncbi:retroviral-like aspartic protease, partial [Pseudomonas aeruginosa]
MNKDDSQALDKNNEQKQVSNVTVDDSAIDKYILDIKINNSGVKCHVDLGSQCSLIRQSTAKELNLNIDVREGMPVLRGIGGNLTCPLGVATVSVEVQGLKETIEIYVVEDYVLSYSAL